jgi:RNA polymerase sigma-70 factor (ECF subfamily)
MPHAGRSCRDLVATIFDYIDGELTTGRCRELEKHLSQCPCCDRFTDSLRRAVAVCRASGETRLPEAVQRRARARIAELLDRLSPAATAPAAARPRSRATSPARRAASTSSRSSAKRSSRV